MNPNLNSLKLALKLCLEDQKLSSSRILNAVKDTMSDYAAELKSQATKAENVSDGIKSGIDSFSFNAASDYIVRPQEDDAYDPLAVYGAAMPVPLYGAAGQDTISFNFNPTSSSSDTISF